MTRPIVPPPVYLAVGLAAQKMLVRSPRGVVLRNLATAALSASQWLVLGRSARVRSRRLRLRGVGG